MVEVSDHFSEIASVYREVRTTDLEPILYISDALASGTDIVAADIGCGAGRYDLLLFRHLSEGLFLHCVDASGEMLAEQDAYLTGQGIRGFQTHQALADRLPLADESLDSMFTFNACHHFDLPGFLREAGRTLKPGGKLFIYTRTPTQNARNLWGTHFPSFAEKETRLYEVDEVADAVARTPGLELADVTEFHYDRATGLDRLVEQARRRHYSTFGLYSPKEFERAMARFIDILNGGLNGRTRVTWRDGNVRYLVTRAA